MSVTVAELEMCLDKLADVARRSSPEVRRRMVCMKRRLERELAALQSADDEMAQLMATRQPLQTIAASNGSDTLLSSRARHSSVPPTP